MPFAKTLIPITAIAAATVAMPNVFAMGGDDASTSVDYFRATVAPMLQARCVGCHGGKRAENGLRLDSGAALAAGSAAGAVIAPGQAQNSRLFQVVAGTASDGLRMPPEGHASPSAQELAALKRWIDAGAQWPTDVALAPSGGRPAANPKDHWSYRPIRRPTPPALAHGDVANNPIDRFVFHRLEARGIAPAPPADAATLCRRLHLDLVGLPPTPVELAAFLQEVKKLRALDSGATVPKAAVDRLIDRLLASPHYGERWARPWLDLCHYADTDGYLTDQARPVAWRYRAWLVDALNSDMPFDRFTVEQLAGDLLPNATVEQRLATGFLRNTLSNREGGADLEEFRVEQVVDRVRTIGTTWLGLTVGCARCHDHKFDALTQREFFGLYAFFNDADEVNIEAPLPGEANAQAAALAASRQRRSELLRPLAGPIEMLQRRWEAKLLAAVARPGADYVWDRQWEVLGLIWGGQLGEGQLEGTQIVRTAPARRTAADRDRLLDYFLKHGEVVDPARWKELKLAELAGELERLAKSAPLPSRAPTIRASAWPVPTFVHVRGDFRRQGSLVPPGVPATLPPLRLTTESWRLTFAKWLTDRANPLPARVFANRTWQELFGTGLVATSENFGVRGDLPSHPELLDWLAAEFAQPTLSTTPWSMKALHRLIVGSATYQQSSHARPELDSVDPANRLLARQTALRLNADQIRDAVLASSGLLDRRVGGPAVFPPQPASVAMEGFENHWTPSEGPDRFRRGLYTYIQRLSPFAQAVTFDAPNLSQSCSRRERSNSPLQALTLLNDPVFFDAAKALAGRVCLARPGNFDAQLELAFLHCLGRRPTRTEAVRLAEFHRQEIKAQLADPKEPAKWAATGDKSAAVEAAAWTALASVLFNLHEFITRS